MTQLFVNNYATTVAATFGVADTQLTVDSTVGLPALTGGDTLRLTVFRKTGVEEREHEVIMVTSWVGNALTVVRAVESAAASQFLIGDRVEARVTAQSLQAKADLSLVNTKQNTLVSGANLRTLNGKSLLGSADIVIAAGVTSVNGLTGSVTLPPPQYIEYGNRATLRSQTPAAGALAIVDGLGLFVWESASTEPDDDESAFATGEGVWLLKAAHWDLVDSWQAPDQQALADDDEDEPLRFASSFASKVLTGSATCTITSVAAANSASFTGTVTGASVGDRVIATPPTQLGDNASSTGNLGYHAWVSAANTVTVMLTNASAASATTNTAIRTGWLITVIKS